MSLYVNISQVLSENDVISAFFKTPLGNIHELQFDSPPHLAITFNTNSWASCHTFSSLKLVVIWELLEVRKSRSPEVRKSSHYNDVNENRFWKFSFGKDRRTALGSPEVRKSSHYSDVNENRFWKFSFGKDRRTALGSPEVQKSGHYNNQSIVAIETDGQQPVSTAI